MNSELDQLQKFAIDVKINDLIDMDITHKEFKVVSLFSGCGGLDLGVEGGFEVYSAQNMKNFPKNPFKVIWANEIDAEAVETYKTNLNSSIICDDLVKVSNEQIPDCDIIIGGFPCQDFSIAGKQKGFATSRGKLYKEMVRIVNHKRPKAFIAENVKNIINPKLIDTEKDQPVIKTICEDFEKIGYKVKYKLIKAVEFGVPQKRERVFIVGIRKDIKKEFVFPNSIHPPMTSKQGIDDLWGKENDPTIFNHHQISLARFRPPSKVGTQGNQMIEENGPSHVMRAEHHMNIQAHYRTLSPKNDLMDRSYWRRLTVREAARIQSFPDKFRFIGSKSSCYKQVGNAVPPILGWYIGHALADCLGKI